MPDDRRILIISTTFYPHPHVGAVRMSQWCRHLPEFGWQPLVLTRNYGHTATPEGLSEHVHPQVQVRYYGAAGRGEAPAAGGPGSFDHWWSRARQNDRWRNLVRDTVGRVLIPDTAIRFWRRARQETLATVDQFQPDVVLTTSPPHSIHDLGLWLSRERPGIPWVADFRDPHLIDPRFSPGGLSKVLFARHSRYEQAIYRQAALVTHAIPVYERWTRRHYPTARDKIRILTNGCPVELAERPPRSLDPAVKTKLIGVMGARDEVMRTKIADAAEALVSRGNDVQLRLIGRRFASDDSIRQRMGGRFVATGQLPYGDAISELTNADALVCAVSTWNEVSFGLSSKMFEFLACGRPIIVINPTRSDVLFFRHLQGIRLLSSPSDSDLLDALAWSIRQSALPSVKQTEHFRMEYSRRNQVARLAGWLDKLLDSTRRVFPPQSLQVE